MKILFDNITVLFENGVADTELYLLVTDKTISYVGKTRPDGIFDRVIDGHGKLLCPGFYNCHTFRFPAGSMKKSFPLRTSCIRKLCMPPRCFPLPR